ncbi:MAG: HNH endonuclease [Verrucomicrobiales bacterium]|jgi:5-methylcytosine-specific restriction endonuclease McrA|nr:HNH endonuclease [Verrucomicrobiales bacterium]
MDSVLNRPVLVLNRLWQAVSVCSAKRALSLLYLGHAEVVDNAGGSYATLDFMEWSDFSRHANDEDCFHTIKFKVRVPQIIVLVLFDKMPRKEVKLTRNNIFERDSYTCQYCARKFERKDLNIDHVIPRDRGGRTTWENVVTSCVPCNTRKSNHLAHQIGMQLLRKPKKPKLRTFINFQISTVPHDSWKHFLDLAYWNVELSD